MQLVLTIQACYYFISGVWPILHYKSFEKITGPKTDVWLVKTVGVLVAVIAAAIFFGARGNGEVNVSTLVLAFGAAIALTIVDLYYSLTGKISKIYIVDAILEVGFITVGAIVG